VAFLPLSGGAGREAREESRMKRALIALALLGGCGGGEPGDDSASNAAAPGAAGQEADGNRLTGLYEGGTSARPNQLCMIEGESGEARFGIVVWGANDHSCSGAGEATRKDGKLVLAMAGDESCRIEASIEGGTLSLPATLPEGCAYYCGARAQFGAARFSRRGGSEADAMRATDLAGDPLCG
jgi:hypothetical protein